MHAAPKSAPCQTDAESRLLALNRRAGRADQCPKLGVERTQSGHAATAESDPTPEMNAALLLQCTGVTCYT